MNHIKTYLENQPMPNKNVTLRPQHAKSFLVRVMRLALMLGTCTGGGVLAAPPVLVEEEPSSNDVGKSPQTVYGDIYVRNLWGNVETKVNPRTGSHRESTLCVEVANKGPHTSPSYQVQAYLSKGMKGSVKVIDIGMVPTLGKGQTKRYCQRVERLIDEHGGTYTIDARLQVTPYNHQAFKNLPVYRSVDPNLNNNRLRKSANL